MRWLALVVAGLAVSAGAMAPSLVRACSPARCSSGAFVPGDGATIPANAPALAWWPPHNPGEGPSVLERLRLLRVDAESQPVGFELEARGDGLYWIKPAQALVAGARYRLETSGECATVPSEFDVGEERALPEQLGTARLEPERYDPGLSVATSSGSCVTPVPSAVIDARVELSADAEPWAALLLHTVRVDDAAWSPVLDAPTPTPGAQSSGTTLYSECPGDLDEGRYHQALSAGDHVLVFDAELPGREQRLSTARAAFHIDCDDVHDNGCSATGAGAAAGNAYAPWSLATLGLLGSRAWSRRRRRRA